MGLTVVLGPDNKTEPWSSSHPGRAVTTKWRQDPGLLAGLWGAADAWKVLVNINSLGPWSLVAMATWKAVRLGNNGMTGPRTQKRKS